MNSRNKGSRGEREVAEILNSKVTGARYRRTPLSGGLEIKGDIINIGADKTIIDDFHWEIKFCSSLMIPAWLRQSERDCPVEKIPIICFKYNRKWRVIIELEEFLDNLK